MAKINNEFNGIYGRRHSESVYDHILTEAEIGLKEQMQNGIDRREQLKAHPEATSDDIRKAKAAVRKSKEELTDLQATVDKNHLKPAMHSEAWQKGLNKN